MQIAHGRETKLTRSYRGKIIRALAYLRSGPYLAPGGTRMFGRFSARDSLPKIPLAFVFAGITLISTGTRLQAQQRRVPPGGRIAVVVDPRLSALRAAPNP